MTKYNFEICFVCRFPTTDYSIVNGGEFHCALCMEDSYYASDEEVDALFAAAEHDWTLEELEDFYQETFR
jgi:hypothetical protein